MLARALTVLTLVVVLFLWILSFLAFCKAFSFIYFWRILFNLFIFIFQHSKFSFIWIDFPPTLASVDYTTCFCPLLDLFDSCRVWTQRILQYLFIYLFLASFSVQLLGISELLDSEKYSVFFVFINSTGYSLVFTEFLKVYEWAFARSSKPCLWELKHRAWTEIVLCVLVWFCHWCSGLCQWVQSVEDTLLNSELITERKIGVVFSPHLAFCGYFSWFFGKCYLPLSSCGHISLKFLLCIIQLGIRKKYLQSYSIPYFLKYLYLNDLTLIARQLSEGQWLCFFTYKSRLTESKWQGHIIGKSGTQIQDFWVQARYFSCS